jgi:speckle-type POZ protein
MVDISYTEVEKLVSFFYTGDYSDDIDDAKDKDMEGVSILQLHARMFAVGDRYDIPTLMEVANEKFSTRCKDDWKPEEFLATIKVVYETTPRSLQPLRQFVSGVVRPKIAEIFQDETTATLCNSVLDAVPDFAKDLLHLYIKAPVVGYCNVCQDYGAMEPLQVRCKGCRKGLGSW